LHGAGDVAWLLIYPDAYEVGCPPGPPDPVRDSQRAATTRSLSARRAVARHGSRDAVCRVPLFSVDTHQPADAFEHPRLNLSPSSSTPTSELHRSGRRPGADCRPRRSASDRDRGRALARSILSPWPTSSTRSRSGDGEEVVADVTGAVNEHGGDRPRCLRAPRRSDGVYVRDVRRHLRRPRLVDITPKYDDVLGAGRATHVSPTWRLAVSQAATRAAPEVVHDRLNVEIFRGCTRGCRFCQAGRSPPRARASCRAGAQMVSDGRPAHRHDESQPHVVVERGLLRHRRSRRRHHQRPRCVRARCGQPAQPARRRVHGGISDRYPEGAPTGADVTRPRGGTWRMRQVINKLIPRRTCTARRSRRLQGWTA